MNLIERLFIGSAARVRVAVAGLLLTAASARADGPTMTCMTMSGVQVSFGLATKQSDGTLLPIAPLSINFALNQAECFCEKGDLYVTALVTATMLPVGTPTEVWVGNGCDNSANRAANTVNCTQLARSSTAVFSAGQSTAPQQLISVRALVAPPSFNQNSPTVPNPNTSFCPSTTVSNQVWFLFNPSAGNVADSCSITLPVDTQLPAPPVSVTAGSGDGRVILNWTAPPIGTLIPANYQILCADSNGMPIPALQSQYRGSLGYSTCTAASGLERRALPTAGTVATDDGGVATDDAGVAGAPLTPDATPTDGGTPALLTADTGRPFGNLDSEFVCSDLIMGSTTSISVEGLTNGQTYYFTVVGIDPYGNPAASPVVTGTPQPVEDLYRRFRDQGGKAQGFCFIATAAYGSYESPYVRVLRDFRDRILLTNDPGRAFVAWYYRASPPWASYIATRPSARLVARQALWPVIVFAALWLWLAGWQKALVVLLIFWLPILAKRVRSKPSLPGRPLTSPPDSPIFARTCASSRGTDR